MYLLIYPGDLRPVSTIEWVGEGRLREGGERWIPCLCWLIAPVVSSVQSHANIPGCGLLRYVDSGHNPWLSGANLWPCVDWPTYPTFSHQPQPHGLYTVTRDIWPQPGVSSQHLAAALRYSLGYRNWNSGDYPGWLHGPMARDCGLGPRHSWSDMSFTTSCICQSTGQYSPSYDHWASQLWCSTVLHAMYS